MSLYIWHPSDLIGYKMKKIIIILAFLLGISSVLFFNRQVKYTVTIKKPIEEVWAYASDSNKATDYTI